MADDPVVIRALIVDDEALARRTLRRLLERDPQIQVVGETWGSDSPAVIRATAPDLLLLDIQMPGLNGLEVLQELDPEEIPLVIFVTAYDEHAIRAFELRALDYVVKPFTDHRLLEAVKRAKEMIRDRETESAQRRLLQLLRGRLLRAESAPGPADRGDASGSARTAQSARVAVRDGGRILLLQAPEIIWIEAAGSYSRIHFEGHSELVRTSLGTLEEQLDPARFFRIHRSAIVALDRVQEVRHESHGDYIVELRDGTELRLARSRKEEFDLRVGLD